MRQAGQSHPFPVVPATAGFVVLAVLGLLGFPWPVLADDPVASTRPRRGDLVDARLPRHAESESLWSTTLEMADEGNWTRAVSLLQRVLDLPEDAMISDGGTKWTSLRSAAFRQLAKWPAEARAEYERQFGALAAAEFQQALQSRDRDRMVSVASRYLHTTAGQQAAAQLATWHLDEGEFLSAAGWHQQLRLTSWPGINDPRWELQSRWTAVRAGIVPSVPEAGPADDAELLLGGRRVRVRDWWKQFGNLTAQLQPLSEWLMFGGSASHVATAAEGLPVLVSDWHQPLTQSAAADVRIRELLADLRRDRKPLIPALSPVVVGPWIAFRDLQSVQVIDRQTGESLWHTEEGLSPERILAGFSQDVSDANGNRIQVRMDELEDSTAHNVDLNPLTTLLFRDVVNGHLSSDGTRLFVLEDVAVLSRDLERLDGEGEADLVDPFGANWENNRLTAYDLATGRSLWTIGGPAEQGVASLPLAGAFFMGAPVADRDELLVVASHGEEIRLHALESSTGQPRWSQLLAFADSRLDRDLTRRWMSAEVAVREGLIVCPTTVGWVVAVDRSRRTISWVHRYLPRTRPDDAESSTTLLPTPELTEAWAPCPPLLDRGLAYLTLPDSQDLICLNLLDGSVRWKRPRDHGLYLIPTPGDLLVVVETDRIRGLTRLKGDVAWTLPLPKEAQVTGRGCIAGSEILVPLGSQGVQVIDWKSGTLRQTLAVEQGTSLGNLVKVADRLISAGVEGVGAFREREYFLQQIETGRQAIDLVFSQALLKARLSLLDRKPRAALADLDAIQLPWPSDLQEQRDQILRNAVLQLLTEHPPDALMLLERLAPLAKSRTQLRDWQQARVGVLLDLGRAHEAWQFLRTLDQATFQEELRQSPGADFARSSQSWLSGQLQRVWIRSQASDRDRIAQELTSEVQSTLGRPLDDRLRLWNTVSFHPAAAPLAWSLAEDWASASMFSHAELTLLPLADHADPFVALNSRMALARLWHRFGLGDDARRLLEQSLQRFGPGQPLVSGTSFAEASESLVAEIGNPPPVSAFTAVHRQQPLFANRLPAGQAPPVQELAGPLEWPSFDQLLMQLEPLEGRISFRSTSNSNANWIRPLRGATTFEEASFVPHATLGHGVVVLYRNILQYLSPIRREVLWSIAIEDDAESRMEAFRPTPSPLFNTSHFSSSSIPWTTGSQGQGRLAAVRPEGIVLVGRRSLTVYDPLTGRERWSCRELPAYPQVEVTRSDIYVLDEESESVAIYSLLDGDRQPHLEWKTLKKTLCSIEDDLILIDASGGFRVFGLAVPVKLSRWNPRTGQTVWNHKFPIGSQLGRLDDRTLLVVGPPSGSGKKRVRTVEQLNLMNGQRVELAPLPVDKDDDSITPILDRHRLFLLVNTTDYGNYNYGDSLPATRVHGTIHVYDRMTGRHLWQRTVHDQNLVLDRMVESPVLLFLARNWNQVGDATYTTLFLLALDKETGQVRHESQSSSLFTGFHGVQLAEPEHELELLSYNMRLRLSATPEEPPTVITPLPAPPKKP